jgi:hypothetical protein
VDLQVDLQVVEAEEKASAHLSVKASRAFHALAEVYPDGSYFRLDRGGRGEKKR